MYVRRKLFSDAASPQGKSSLPKKVTIKEGRDDSSAGNNRVRLKIIRAITEDENIDSYRKSLTKSSSTDAIKAEVLKLKELKINSSSPFRKDMKAPAIKSL
jgi:hypothetical protein